MCWRLRSKQRHRRRRRHPWQTTEADFIARNVRFGTGETPAGSAHPLRDARPSAPQRRNGDIDNAVMLLHGTGGTGHQFLAPQFADELFGPGQPLDIQRYWIIMPDNLGHGRSSKPSDGCACISRATTMTTWSRCSTGC